MALVVVLMFSCNKNRFDLDHLESVEASGQWKLPIGNVKATVGDVMTQLGENELISYDEDGNLKMEVSYAMDDLVKGSTFLSLGSLNANWSTSFPNPFPGMSLPEPIDTVFRFDQHMLMTTDSARLESVILNSGTLLLSIVTNLGNVSEIVLSSPDVTYPSGDTLYEVFTEVNHEVDLAGATFRLTDPVTGVQDSTFVLNYAIHYQLTGIDAPEYEVNTILGLNQLKIKEMSGYIDHFEYAFSFDTTVTLPLNNIEGALSLVGTELKIKEKNTFGNLNATLSVNQAELYGPNVAPSPIFNTYPTVINIVPSTSYVPVFDETLNLSVSTQHNGVRVDGLLDFNPNGVETLLTVADTSALGLALSATVPMQFNVSNVAYLDTIDLNVDDVEAPELVRELLMNILFKSELPFNINAQFLTLNTATGMVTDSLLTNELQLKGSFDGSPVETEANISITHDLLESVMAADKLIMRLGLDTDGNDVMLNLDNAIDVTLKADVLYDGAIEVNN